MTFLIYLVAILSSGAITLMAIRADRQLRPVDRLPIHWNWKLEPDNFGSRRFALYLMPFLFGAILMGTALSLHLIPQGAINKTGSSEEAVILMIFMAAIFVGIKYFYLRALFRWVERDES
ncbi:MAG: DUF1648 domain-containing protein [Pseudomonadota bacterium]